MNNRAGMGAVILAGALCLASCHVGGGYTVGGTVTGLRGSGLVLEDNSGNSLKVGADGSFQFSDGIDQGGTYSVTVATQPSNPAQTCIVHNGSGTIGTADIGNVVVSCLRPGTFAYVVNQGSSTLSAYSIDASSGELSPVAGSPFASTGTTPVAAVVDPNGAYLYVANNGSNTVSIYAIDATTGALSSPGAPIATGNGPFALLIDPANQFLYVANKTDDTVSVFEIESGGTATPVSGSPYAVGHEPTSLQMDPGGNFLYVTNYGDGTISAFSVQAGAGMLAPIAGSPFAAEAGALSIAIDPTGTLAYVANETAASVSAYSISTDTGTLAPLSGFPLATGTHPEAVTVDPGGRFLLIPDIPADNDFTSYAITPSTGALTHAATVAAGSFPLGVALAPSGDFVYVANEDSNTVSGYALDATTGALVPLPGSPYAAGSGARAIAID